MAKKLYRSTTDKMIGGVAGGLSEYFDIDATLIRVLFVVVVFLGGGGILAYIILWIVVPERPYEIPKDYQAKSDKDEEKKNEFHYSTEESESLNINSSGDATIETKTNSRQIWIAIILIVIGGLLLLDNIFPRFNFDHYWPVILIVIGIGLLLKAKN